MAWLRTRVHVQTHSVNDDCRASTQTQLVASVPLFPRWLLSTRTISFRTDRFKIESTWNCGLIGV